MDFWRLRLIEQQITRLFILLHIDTIFIDRPADFIISPLETVRLLWYATFLVPSVRLSLVYRSSIVRLPSFGLSVFRLSIVLSFVVLYILKAVSSWLSANRYISLFGLDESRAKFSSQLSFVLDETPLNTCPASLIINRDRMIPHVPRTYARIPWTHVITNGTFLLYHIRLSCIDIRPGYLSTITIL